jgi:hypothetical protein
MRTRLVLRFVPKFIVRDLWKHRRLWSVIGVMNWNPGRGSLEGWRQLSPGPRLEWLPCSKTGGVPIAAIPQHETPDQVCPSVLGLEPFSDISMLATSDINVTLLVTGYRCGVV